MNYVGCMPGNLTPTGVAELLLGRGASASRPSVEYRRAISSFSRGKASGAAARVKQSLVSVSAASPSSSLWLNGVKESWMWRERERERERTNKEGMA